MDDQDESIQLLKFLEEEHQKLFEELLHEQDDEELLAMGIDTHFKESREEKKRIQESLKMTEEAVREEMKAMKGLLDSIEKQKKMMNEHQRENDAEMEKMVNLMKQQKKELEMQRTRHEKYTIMQETLDEQKVKSEQKIKDKDRQIKQLLIAHADAMQAVNDRWRRIHPKNDNKSADIPTVQTITVLKGLNLPKMDLFGKTDAYVTVKIGGQKFKTNVISTKQDAAWNETFGVNVDSKDFDQIVFGIYDQDKFSDDDLIAEVVLGKEELEKGKKIYHFPLVNSKGKAIQKKGGEQGMLEVAIECSDN